MSCRRERKDAIEHRRLILQTAQSLFNQHGVHSVSMHQIAKTAGVGQATLYRRYAHKGDLCSELLQDFSEQLIEQFKAYLRDHTRLSPVERLGGLLNRWIDAIEEKADLIVVTMEAKIICDDTRGNFFHTPLYKTLRELISGLLAEMIGPEVSNLIDTKLTAHALICSMSPAGYFHMKQEFGYTPEQIKQGYLRMCQLSVR
ncbi:TetR/AcrR family transcriptional regulator [Cohnella panacarvi]|uniref:TetR/AcrR family transcriptional regulator n=1 Tax=Cohnella panacarvi TaxID=400776 RepID=UPI00047BF710|nr:TetR/AcrR family transcriptional regulator [Cohnella panacarvi]